MPGGKEYSESSDDKFRNSDTDTNVVIWASERENYVNPLKVVAFQIKSPAKFGWKTAPYYGAEEGSGGELCTVPWSALKKHRPTTMEIVDSAPLTEFISKLNDEKFFDRIQMLRVYESNGKIEEFCRIIDNSPILSVVEFYEPGCGAEERQRLLNSLASRKELKGYDFICNFSGAELNEWFKGLRTKLRLVRFSGPPGVKFSAVKLVNIDMPLVEFLAVQDIDVDTETKESTAQWQRNLLNRFCHMFPGLKYCHLDYKIFDTVFIYDDDTVGIFKLIRDFFFRMELVCFSILVYCPDDEMKESVSKAAKFLATDCNIRTEVKHFFRGAPNVQNVPTNFALFVLGDQVHRRTERLVETIVDGKNTTPDLRHFCYVMDQDPFIRPNCKLAFGGFDEEAVKYMYNENHVSKSSPCFVPDTVVDRYVQG